MSIRYFKKLTLRENAEKNKCSVSTIKAHLLKLNLSASKARRAAIAEKINNAKVELEKDGKKATIKAICNLTTLSNKTVIKYLHDDVKTDITKSTPKSYSYKQFEILQNIINLYLSGVPVQCDLTFNVGKMWNGLLQPTYLFDLKPQLKEVRQLDEVRQFNNFFASCVIDLPFIIRSNSMKSNSLIHNRFDTFSSEKELFEVNTSMLELAHQILKQKGICIVKTQDTCYAGKQIWTHLHVMNEAIRFGFKIEDTFICLRKNMLIKQHITSKHARKQHCYFIILKKIKQ